MKTTLFIPTLNEINGIKAVMPHVKREWVDEILVVDGNSTDGTAEWFRENGYRVLSQKSRGLSGAYWECIEAAEGDVILLFTPDGNSVPELIPLMVEKMREGADLVIASRYLAGAKSHDDDVVTGFGNWMFTKLTRLLHGGNVTDVLVAYRAFRKSLFKTLDLTQSDHPYFEQELVIRAIKHKLKIAEIPGDEPARIGGVRKMRVLYNGSWVLYGILRELFVHRVKPK